MGGIAAFALNLFSCCGSVKRQKDDKIDFDYHLINADNDVLN